MLQQSKKDISHPVFFGGRIFVRDKPAFFITPLFAPNSTLDFLLETSSNWKKITSLQNPFSLSKKKINSFDAPF